MAWFGVYVHGGTVNLPEFKLCPYARLIMWIDFDLILFPYICLHEHRSRLKRISFIPFLGGRGEGRVLHFRSRRQPARVMNCVSVFAGFWTGQTLNKHQINKNINQLVKEQASPCSRSWRHVHIGARRQPMIQLMNSKCRYRQMYTASSHFH